MKSVKINWICIYILHIFNHVYCFPIIYDNMNLTSGPTSYESVKGVKPFGKEDTYF
jgi:hypothetical protein